MISRRTLLGRLGAGLVLAPLAAFLGPEIAGASVESRLDSQAPTSPPESLFGLSEPVLGRATLYPYKPIIPEYWFEAGKAPSLYDPLGEWGYIFIIYTVEGVTRRNWLKISDMLAEANLKAVKQEGFRVLFEHENETLALYHPGYGLSLPETWIPNSKWQKQFDWNDISS